MACGGHSAISERAPIAWPASTASLSTPVAQAKKPVPAIKWTEAAVWPLPPPPDVVAECTTLAPIPLGPPGSTYPRPPPGGSYPTPDYNCELQHAPSDALAFEDFTGLFLTRLIPYGPIDVGYGEILGSGHGEWF